MYAICGQSVHPRASPHLHQSRTHADYLPVASSAAWAHARVDDGAMPVGPREARPTVPQIDAPVSSSSIADASLAMRPLQYDHLITRPSFVREGDDVTAIVMHFTSSDGGDVHRRASYESRHTIRPQPLLPTVLRETRRAVAGFLVGVTIQLVLRVQTRCQSIKVTPGQPSVDPDR